MQASYGYDPRTLKKSRSKVSWFTARVEKWTDNMTNCSTLLTNMVGNKQYTDVSLLPATFQTNLC